MSPVTSAFGQYYTNNVNDSGQINVYAMLNPPKGSMSLAIALSGGYFAVSANSASYTGVGSLGAGVFASGNSAAPSQSATGGNSRGGFFHMFGSFGNFTSYNQNQRWLVNPSGNPRACLLGDALGVAAPTFTGALSAGTVWGSVIVPLLPV